MKFSRYLALSGLLVAGLWPSLAVSQCLPGDEAGECGWFWGDDFENPAPSPSPTPTLPPTPEKPPEPAQEPEKPLPPVVSLTEEERCSQRETWDAQCGFIEPGKDWEFMKLQERELLHAMILTPESPKQIKEYQKFTFWAVDRAAEIAHVWTYNVIQDQELNTRIQAPVSQFGLRMAARERDLSRANFYKTLQEEGAFLAWFTRSDCNYCKEMLSAMRQLSYDTGLEVWNASLDDQCMRGYEDRCMAGERVVYYARHLKVLYVPDLILYIPADETWVRIASGLESLNTIKTRINLYGKAVQAAMVNGLASDIEDQTSADFTRDVRKTFSRGEGYQETGVP